MKKQLLLLCLNTWIVMAGMAQQAGINWQSQQLGIDRIWRSVTFGNGTYVAVSADQVENSVMTSTDGNTWTIRSAFAQAWESVTYGNGLFVAVSTSGTGNRVMTSPDGINWTSRTSAKDNNWLSVTYGNGLFVAVSESGNFDRVMTSPDGINWTSRTTPSNSKWISVTYGNNLFVAVAAGGTTDKVMTSPDGINWTIRTSPATSNYWTSVTYGNGLFVAVAATGAVGNRVMTSPDGINWTIRTSAADIQWNSVTYGNSMFVAVASTGTGNRAMTSPDGINWTSRTTPYDASFTSVIFNNSNQFVAVALSGYGKCVMNSSNGTTWNMVNSAPGDLPYRGITFGNNLFVAVASAGLMNNVITSPDGINWTSRAPAANNSWMAITYGNGLFVAVSFSGLGNQAMTSPDGITWTSRTTPGSNTWSSVTYGNGLFVAVATNATSNRVMTSPDGINWTLRTHAASNTWSSVTYGNGLFVAVSSSGTGNRVMTSPDGINWTSRTSASDNNWQSVTYGNGLFVAVSTSGTGDRVMTSPDGINWTSRTSAADNNWQSVTYGNGLFVAVSNSGIGNRIMTSPDGINWTSRTSTADNFWYTVTSGAGKFVAVSASGNGNRVMTSSGSSCTAPTITATQADSSCGTGNVTLTATPSAGKINWYTAATGGTALENNSSYSISGNSITLNNLNATTTLYAEAIDTPCISESRTAIIAKINPIPGITLGSIGSVTNTATSFSIPYSATTGSPNQYSIAVGTPTAMPGFSAITNASLTSSPIQVSIPASSENTYNFNLSIKNTTTGCQSAAIPFALTVGNPPPGLSIKNYVPSSGNIGSTVTVKGTGFVNVIKVWFGGSPAESFTVINDSTLEAVVPATAYLGNIAVATTTDFKIGKMYFYVKNPQNVMIPQNGQYGAFFLKNGKLYGQYVYDYDGGNTYRYCPVEMPAKGSLRGKTISQLSNGSQGFIALASDNTVHTWGTNNFKQLGDSSNAFRKRYSVDITQRGDFKGKTVIQVLAGSDCYYGLTEDGLVCSWGRDTLGNLGNGAATNGIVYSPTSINHLGSLVGKTIIKLAKGIDASYENNVFAIASDGTIHGWGVNSNSALGLGHSNVVEEPVQINQSGALAGKTIVDIDSRNAATLLLDEEGNLYGMGLSGQIGLSGPTIRTVPDSINNESTSSLYQKRVLSMVLNRTSSSSIVLDADGKVHAMGNNALTHLGTGSPNSPIPPVLVEATTSSIAGKVVVAISQTQYAYYVTTSDKQMHVFGVASSYQHLNGLSSPTALVAKLIPEPFPVPSSDATDIEFLNITGASATIKWKPGLGAGCLVLVKANNPIDTLAPVNGSIYTAKTNLTGSVLDTNARVVYRGFGDSVSISNLTSGTRYHVSVFEFDTFSNPCNYDIFKLGTPLMGSFVAYSGPSLASINTATPSSISANSADLGGNVTSDGGASVSERGVVYATTSNPTTSSGTKVQIGSGTGNFSQTVTGLSSNTTYFVRAYAINSVGTSYGSNQSFTTDAIPVPSISLSASFDPFSTCQGTASSAQQFTVGGINLSGDITITAPAGFEVSSTLASGYTASLKLTPVSGIVAASTLYLRINSSATGTPAGSLTASSPDAIIQNKTVIGTLNPSPAKPVISIQPATPVCQGAQFLNFGAASAPASGVSYQWTAQNASLYAQGSTKQYSLISFPNAGTAVVTLTASQNGCSASTSVDIAVNAEQAHTATVRYFNKNFVCEANLVQKYQWGYDDLPILKGNTLTGEINQNYYNATPETASKA
ncbi:MAG: hypothetical protein L6Q78_15905, partial [Bacteroidia bacterium]|nr:hypothetical protein [Bacteroidia bacterium]